MGRDSGTVGARISGKGRCHWLQPPAPPKVGAGVTVAVPSSACDSPGCSGYQLGVVEITAGIQHAWQAPAHRISLSLSSSDIFTPSTPRRAR
jgi:hypothetical protein